SIAQDPDMNKLELKSCDILVDIKFEHPLVIATGGAKDVCGPLVRARTETDRSGERHPYEVLATLEVDAKCHAISRVSREPSEWPLGPSLVAVRAPGINWPLGLDGPMIATG